MILTHKSFLLNIVSKLILKKVLELTFFLLEGLSFYSRVISNNLGLMQNLLQRDLGSSLLSVAIIFGWLGLFFVFLRILTISIKRILESLLKK